MGEPDMLSIATERFERRLAQEIGGLEMRLRKEMHEGFTEIRKEVSDFRAEVFKCSLMFWVGQFAAIGVLVIYLARVR